MAVLPLRVAPDPVLRQKAKRVRAIDPKIEKLIDDMIETMPVVHGVGLAAPQVGASVRVVVVDIPDQGPVALINPEIVKRSGEREVSEACLSVPGYRGWIKRSNSVTVKARDRHWKEIRLKATGLLAQCLEHEIDHLNGLLYVDHVESQDKLERVEAEEEQGL
ncbi:MAG: peptide deformylase [Chloroflexi bacterium]|nr:MAG: peptide deformylase [Chloroflexota bacterium]RLC96329.1 MAG: peptide deformylase [Chloroflexota bacterium]